MAVAFSPTQSETDHRNAENSAQPFLTLFENFVHDQILLSPFQFLSFLFQVIEKRYNNSVPLWLKFYSPKTTLMKGHKTILFQIKYVEKRHD